MAVMCDAKVEDGGEPRACPQVYYGPRNITARYSTLERAEAHGWQVNQRLDTAFCPEHAP